MKAKASNLTIKARLRLLLGMSLALAAIIAGFSYFALTRAQKIAELQMKERLLQGEKSRLELTVRSFAESLAKAMATVPDHQEQIALVRKAVGDIRFQEDKSGYYFLYEGTVARVVGPNPAIEGKDLGEQDDANGVHFVQELANRPRRVADLLNTSMQSRVPATNPSCRLPHPSGERPIGLGPGSTSITSLTCRMKARMRCSWR
jgi:methyl-accepting chemotaxis protein